MDNSGAENLLTLLLRLIPNKYIPKLTHRANLQPGPATLLCVPETWGNYPKKDTVVESTPILSVSFLFFFSPIFFAFGFFKFSSFIAILVALQSHQAWDYILFFWERHCRMKAE